MSNSKKHAVMLSDRIISDVGEVMINFSEYLERNGDLEHSYHVDDVLISFFRAVQRCEKREARKEAKRKKMISNLKGRFFEDPVSELKESVCEDPVSELKESVCAKPISNK